MNFISGKLVADGEGLVFDEGNIKIALPVSYNEQLGDHKDQEVVMGIRPEDIHDPDTMARDVKTADIEAKVEVVEPMGNEVFLNLTTGKSAFVARIDPRHMPEVEQTVKLAVEVGKAHFFDMNNETSLI